MSTFCLECYVKVKVTIITCIIMILYLQNRPIPYRSSDNANKPIKIHNDLFFTACHHPSPALLPVVMFRYNAVLIFWLHHSGPGSLLCPKGIKGKAFGAIPCPNGLFSLNYNLILPNMCLIWSSSYQTLWMIYFHMGILLSCLTRKLIRYAVIHPCKNKSLNLCNSNP